jgi:hypothetical protein
MRRNNLTPQVMVTLPLELAYDVILACDIAEIHIEVANEFFAEKPKDFSEEMIILAKSDFEKVQNLKKVFLSMCNKI